MGALVAPPLRVLLRARAMGAGAHTPCVLRALAIPESVTAAAARAVRARGPCKAASNLHVLHSIGALTV